MTKLSTFVVKKLSKLEINRKHLKNNIINPEGFSAFLLNASNKASKYSLNIPIQIFIGNHIVTIKGKKNKFKKIKIEVKEIELPLFRDRIVYVS